LEPTISSLIASAEGGDPKASEELFAALYSELHRLAERSLARGGRGLTLGTTTLLHEAYLDMTRRESVFPDRGRFMAYASRVMRNLIVDHFRNRSARKRGGSFEISSVDFDLADSGTDPGDLLSVARAMDDLASVDPQLAEVVDLKFFCGFSFTEIAALRGVSERTVQRQWAKARLYLRDAIQRPGPP
jgi:RNA polymerase sigma factor (TIGR02999 family)